MSLNLRNPIPDTIQDLSRITTSINGLPIVPYYGTQFNTGYAVLKLLFEVHELSPSASACINSIAKYAFTGDMDIINAGVPGFITEEQEISYSDRLQFALLLENIGIPLPLIKKITEAAEKHLMKCGNAYIYLKESTLTGETRLHAECLHPLNVAYLKPSDDDKSGIRTFVFSENFDQFSSFKFDYKFIRSYPEWTENEGSKETIIHIANYVGKSTWYGRPDSLAVLFEMISEIKAGEQRMKVSATDFVSTMILAFEQEFHETDNQGDESREATATEKGRILRTAMTNTGNNPSALMTIDYPNGGQPPTPIELGVNRDYQYMNASKAISSDAIYSNFDWAKELTGQTQTRGGIGSNMLKDLLSIKYTTTIQPRQDSWSSFWASVFREYFDNGYTIKFPNLIENFNWNANLESEDDAQQSNETNEINEMEE